MAYEPNTRRKSVISITVESVQAGRISDFASYRLDDRTKNSRPYYARVSVKNVGTGDLGGAAVPLLAVDDDNTLIQPSTFNNTFAKCPSLALPAAFGADKSVRGLPGLPRARQGDARQDELPAAAGVRADHLGRHDHAGAADRGPEEGRGEEEGRCTRRPLPRRPPRRRQTRRSRTSLAALAPSTRLPALQLGSLEVTTPVVLAPMAGITNAAYRRLCREQGSLGAGQRPARPAAPRTPRAVSTSAR